MGQPLPLGEGLSPRHTMDMESPQKQILMEAMLLPHACGRQPILLAICKQRRSQPQHAWGRAQDCSTG